LLANFKPLGTNTKVSGLGRLTRKE